MPAREDVEANLTRFTAGDTPNYFQFGPLVDGRAISVTVMGGLYSRVNTP